MKTQSLVILCIIIHQQCQDEDEKQSMAYWYTLNSRHSRNTPIGSCIIFIYYYNDILLQEYFHIVYGSEDFLQMAERSLWEIWGCTTKLRTIRILEIAEAMMIYIMVHGDHVEGKIRNTVKNRTTLSVYT